MARNTLEQSDITKAKVFNKDGSFNRPAASFRNFISENGEFPPELGRYHLYISYACPWAHRTLILRKLKGLEDVISFSAVSPHMGEHGWPFANVDPYPGATTDPHVGAEHVKDLYLKTNIDYNGRFSVPVLWDIKNSVIVNNESSEIIRMLNSAFNGLLPPEKAQIDLYPENLKNEIDELNTWVYNEVNNGVYKCGMAQSQSAYEAAVEMLFKALDRLEKILEGKKYLIGGQLTEADVRLYATIVRFDPVYYGLFKCNLKMIRSGYPNLNRWCKELYWTQEAFSSTTRFDHIKDHYYWSLIIMNPSRVVPLGPVPVIESLS